MENERIKTVLNKLIASIRSQQNNLSFILALTEIQDELNQPEEPQGYQGKFAEVVKEDVKTDYGNTEKMLEALKGMDKTKYHDVSKFYEETNITDKELLNECKELFTSYVIGEGIIIHEAKELLTKINKYLNHD